MLLRVGVKRKQGSRASILLLLIRCQRFTPYRQVDMFSCTHTQSQSDFHCHDSHHMQTFHTLGLLC